MNLGRVRLFSFSALVLTVLGSASYTMIAQETRTPQTLAGDRLLTEFASYKQWSRVNDVPLPITISLRNDALLTGGGPLI